MAPSPAPPPRQGPALPLGSRWAAGVGCGVPEHCPCLTSALVETFPGGGRLARLADPSSLP